MDFGEVFALTAVTGGFIVILYPLVRALAKRIAGEHRRPGLDFVERDEILNELQAVRQELTELAERVDFTERLLARQQQDALPRPGS